MKTKTLRKQIGNPDLPDREVERAQRELRRRHKMERKNKRKNRD